jgi:hypothetical protein
VAIYAIAASMRQLRPESTDSVENLSRSSSGGPHRRLLARQRRASSPHGAKIGGGRGMSLASFRRFWAVAANRNSSFAPLGPRRRIDQA